MITAEIRVNLDFAQIQKLLAAVLTAGNQIAYPVCTDDPEDALHAILAALFAPAAEDLGL